MKRLERNIGESLGQLIARKMVNIESKITWRQLKNNQEQVDYKTTHSN